MAPAAPVREAVAEPFYKGPQPMDYGPRSAVWIQGFGDYERWKETTTTTNCGGGAGGPIGAGCAAGGATDVPLGVSVVRKVTSWGFVGGADWTFRNIAWGGDALITGVLTGYMHADAQFDGTVTSSNPGLVPSGSSTLKATVAGPSVGVFATYFNGAGFSTDITFKTDFLDVDESFSELLGFGAAAGNPAFVLPITGSGSTSALNYVTFGNVNYRMPFSPYTWWEPTAGFKFTYTDYDDASAALLGLKDGHIWRLQGGARFGADLDYYNMRVTPVLTTLLYSDVDIQGGAIQNGVFLGPSILPTEEGKLRFQGIGTLNFDNRVGMKSFVQAEVRAGRDYFGVGGKGGIRFEW
jgi:hypothetical protein